MYLGRYTKIIQHLNYILYKKQSLENGYKWMLLIYTIQSWLNIVRQKTFKINLSRGTGIVFFWDGTIYPYVGSDDCILYLMSKN